MAVDVAPVDHRVKKVKAATRRSLLRLVVSVAVLGVLAFAVWMQRDTIGSALSEIRQLSVLAIATLAMLTAFERLSRAEIVRRLLGAPIGAGRALTIHDVGNAVSKGVPLGGAMGTALRWTVCRESGVRPARFVTMLVAYGVATSFVTWLLPFGALLADLTQRSPDVTDALLLAVIFAVLACSTLFWALVLRSDRIEGWATRLVRRIWSRLENRTTSMQGVDPEAGVVDVRRELRSIGRRPWALLAGTLLAQSSGAVILLVALRSLGVGDELGTSEFFRVFFLVHLAGTFAPTPGGVGVVEAGATGALIAAGVEPSAALAGVLIYRFATYVVPIVCGAALYLVWRVRGAQQRSARIHGHGTPFDTPLPDLPRVADQGLCDDGHAGRHDRAPAAARRGPPGGVLRRWTRAVS